MEPNEWCLYHSKFHNKLQQGNELFFQKFSLLGQISLEDCLRVTKVYIHLQIYRKASCAHNFFSTILLWAELAPQSVEGVTAEREVAGSILGPDQYSGS